MAKNEYREYAVYKGETLLCIGTAKEIAEELNIKPKTVQFLSTPAHLKRIESRGNMRKKGWRCTNSSKIK